MQALRRSCLAVKDVGRSYATSFAAGESALVLPELPYEYSALEPYISADIMALHHGKHHNAYVTNYNNALNQWEEAEKNVDARKLPAIQSALHFNGGGMHEGIAAKRLGDRIRVSSTIQMPLSLSFVQDI